MRISGASLRRADEDICPYVVRGDFGGNGAFSDNIPCANLWQHDDMHDEPELIATLQVGLVASDECSERHEVLIVKNPSTKAEPLSVRLRQIFEEHVRGIDPSRVDPSKKAIGSNGNLD
jgi:hypothetical protein